MQNPVEYKIAIYIDFDLTLTAFSIYYDHTNIFSKNPDDNDLKKAVEDILKKKSSVDLFIQGSINDQIKYIKLLIGASEMNESRFDPISDKLTSLKNNEFKNTKIKVDYFIVIKKEVLGRNTKNMITNLFNVMNKIPFYPGFLSLFTEVFIEKEQLDPVLEASIDPKFKLTTKKIPEQKIETVTEQKIETVTDFMKFKNQSYAFSFLIDDSNTILNEFDKNMVNPSFLYIQPRKTNIYVNSFDINFMNYGNSALLPTLNYVSEILTVFSNTLKQNGSLTDARKKILEKYISLPKNITSTDIILTSSGPSSIAASTTQLISSQGSSIQPIEAKYPEQKKILWLDVDTLKLYKNDKFEQKENEKLIKCTNESNIDIDRYNFYSYNGGKIHQKEYINMTDYEKENIYTCDKLDNVLFMKKYAENKQKYNKL